MAFKKKTWKDRMVEYAGRRKLTNISTNQSIICDVARSEGTVSQEGDALSSQNLNDLEQRIEDGFTEVKQTTDTLNQNLDGAKIIHEGSGASAKVDNVDICISYVQNSTDSSAVAFAFVKKGQTVTTRAQYGKYDIKFYGLC